MAQDRKEYMKAYNEYRKEDMKAYYQAHKEEIHLKIHQYLRDNNIEADSNHFEQIKHLLDDTVVLYGV